MKALRYPDAAQLADLQSGFACQRGLWFDAEAEDDDIGRNPLAVLQDHNGCCGRFLLCRVFE